MNNTHVLFREWLASLSDVGIDSTAFKPVLGKQVSKLTPREIAVHGDAIEEAIKNFARQFNRSIFSLGSDNAVREAQQLGLSPEKIKHVIESELQRATLVARVQADVWAAMADDYESNLELKAVVDVALSKFRLLKDAIVREFHIRT